MTDVSSVNWQQVHDEDFRVPTQHPLAELTADLTRLLGDPDSHQRDTLALSVLATWIERGVYDDLLPGLGDGISAGLRVGLGGRDDDTVFRRSFSALILAECIERDTTRPLVPGGKVLDWGDRLAGWVLAEQDLRGYVPGKGWAHAVAHGADAIGVLARSPHFAAPELTVLLDVIGERVTMAVDHLFVNGEPDRLALATIEVLRRDRVPFDIVEAWLGAIAEVPRRRPGSVRDPHLDTGNVDAYLRALYLQLALGPNPPASRADALLLLIDALRAFNPHFLGRPAAAVAG